MILSTSETANNLAGVCLLSLSSQAVVERRALCSYGPESHSWNSVSTLGKFRGEFCHFFPTFCLRVTPTHSRVCSAPLTQAPACKALDSTRRRPDNIQSMRAVEKVKPSPLKRICSADTTQILRACMQQHHLFMCFLTQL